MARREHTFSIDGTDYTVTQLGTTEGMPLGHKLLRAVGPIFIDLVQGLPKGEMAKLAKATKAGSAEASLAELLDVALEGGLAKAAKTALESVSSDMLRDCAAAFKKTTKFKTGEMEFFLPLGDADFYDDHFAGRYGAWFKWFLACARFNFAGFFPSTGS